MERNTSTSKNREFGVTVLAGTERVFQKILSNSRVMSNNLRGAVCLSGTGIIRAILGRMMVSNQSANLLLNAIPQPLECTSYVPTIAETQKLIIILFWS